MLLYVWILGGYGFCFIRVSIIYFKVGYDGSFYLVNVLKINKLVKEWISKRNWYMNSMIGYV